MAADFAGAQRRLGQSLMARLANARATIGERAESVTVDGNLRRPGVEVRMGSDIMARSRRVSFETLTIHLADVHVAANTPVFVFQDDQDTHVTGAYRVAHGGRIDQLETGTTLLELERA